MGNEFVVPLLGMMGVVVVAGVAEEAAMPAYMMLGSIAMLMALLVFNGSVQMSMVMLQALTLVGVGFALFGHVRAPRRN